MTPVEHQNVTVLSGEEPRTRYAHRRAADHR